jgi:hypothetical protein
MPLWPAPPIIALVGVAIALSQQKIVDLLVVAAIFAAGLVYYLFFVRPRAGYWNVAAQSTAEVGDFTPTPQPSDL